MAQKGTASRVKGVATRLLFWTLLLGLAFWGCAPGAKVKDEKDLLPRDIRTLIEGEYEVTDQLKDNPPRTVAVLPFDNLTDKDEAFEVVRKAFYNHFSSLPYIDVEIALVDDRLKGQDLFDPAKVAKAAPQDVGKIVGADAVVYGDITHYDRIYAVAYSRVSVGAELKMMDTRTGNLLWSGKHKESIHAGGLPTGPVGLILTAISTAVNLRTIQLYRCSDDLFREMVKSIPRPPLAKTMMPPAIKILVQDAAGTPRKAGDVIKVAMEADPHNRAFFDIGTFKTQVAMTEQQKGVYVGEYRVLPGDNVTRAIITGHLLDDQGLEATWIDALGTVTIDTTPPEKPKGLRALGRNERIIVSWKANEEKDLAGYRLYRSDTPLTGYKLLKETEFRTFEDQKLANDRQHYYQVKAFDRAGNESEPSESRMGMPIKPGPTSVGGIVATDTIWYSGASPYVLTEDVLVLEKATLTLEPGCKVLSSGAGIVVKGKITALGEEELRISLAGMPINNGAMENPPKPGQKAEDPNQKRAMWKGLVLEGSKGSALSYCLIRDAVTGLTLKSSSPTVASMDLTGNQLGILITESFSRPEISDSLIHENLGAGVVIKTGAKPTLERNVIRANKGLGVEVRDAGGTISQSRIVGNLVGGLIADKAAVEVTGSDIHDNGPFDLQNLAGVGELKALGNFWGTTNVLKILERIKGRVNISSILDGPAGQGRIVNLNILKSPLDKDITRDAYLLAALSPYVVRSPVAIKGAALYIQAGVEVRYNQSQSILVVDDKGSLVADGRPDAPVVFTANAKGAGAGFYTTAVRFSSPNQRDSTLRYCVFRFAATPIDIHYGRPAISYCVVKENSQSGILSRNNSKPTVSYCSIYKNMGTGGIEVYGSSSPKMRRNNIFDNPFAVQSFSSLQVDARENYWGKESPDKSLFIGDVNYGEWSKEPLEEAFDLK